MSKSMSVRDLYNQGIMCGLWTAQGKCADIIEVPKSTFRLHLEEEGSAAGIAETMRKLSAALKKHTPKAQPPLQVLFLRGIVLGLWTDLSSAATALVVNRAALGRYCAMESGGTSREKQYFISLERKLKRKISAAQKQSGDASSGAAPAHDFVDAQEGNLPPWALQGMEFLAQRVVQGLLPHLPKQIEKQPREGPRENDDPSMPSDWLDEVFAGHRELRVQSLPGVRFVLTAPPFAHLPKGMTPEERGDTKELTKAITAAMAKITLAITELRRRLTLSSQTAELKEREKDIATFGPELEALVIEITRASHSDIGASAEMFRGLHEELAAIREQRIQS